VLPHRAIPSHGNSLLLAGRAGPGFVTLMKSASAKGCRAAPIYRHRRQWPPPYKAHGRTQGRTLGIHGHRTQPRGGAACQCSSALIQFFGAPTVVYLCIDRTLTAWSIFDMDCLRRVSCSRHSNTALIRAAAALLISYPDLIRAELEILEDVSDTNGRRIGIPRSAHPLNQYRSPRRRYKKLYA